MDWLDVVRRLQTIAQAGLAYSQSPFDRERYDALLSLAAAIGEGRVEGSPLEFETLLRAERGYPTPKVDVRAVVSRQDELLFVREITDGKWALPGGWADIGEPPSAMCVREVLEETGYVVEATKLLALLDRAKRREARDLWYVYKVFMRCEIVGGAPRPSYETPELGFFAESALPPLSQPRNTESEVRRMFEHVRNPDLPTDFD